MYTENVLEIKLYDYIANPYWPEMDTIINVQKGIHPKLGPAKKQAALVTNLAKLGYDLDDYAKLQEKIKQQWYKTEQGYIYLPRHQLSGMLVAAIKSAPKAIKGKFIEDSFRSVCRLEDLISNKKHKDSVYERYVKSDSSNQRRFQSNEVITDVTFRGKFYLHEDIKLQDFALLCKYGLQVCGLGASRKMAYGRGELIKPKLELKVNFSTKEEMLELV